MSEIADVPIDRLVANLEAAIAKDPTSRAAQDLQLRLNLARTHAMAYAVKKASVPRMAPDTSGPWFGNSTDAVPFQVTSSANATVNAEARAHLAKAIGVYRELIAFVAAARERPPWNIELLAKLGLAWCIDQSGDKPAAIAAYRGVIDDAWVVEGKEVSLAYGGQSITQEAAGYLIPLLDRVRDKDEVATLRQRIATINATARRWITPIAVPLRDGLRAADLEDRAARVLFDADGSGVKKPWTWITPDAAWLVSDMHHRGHITSSLQLFGNVTWWLFWENGYQALGALDDNRDGELRGRELDGLALWRDANSNGVSEPGEVRPLSEYGITALSYRYEYDASHPDEIAYAPSGVTFANGTTRPIYDLILHWQPARAAAR